MSVDFEKYTGTVGANTNVNIVKSNARSSGKSNDIGKSGDVTLNKVGIRNVSKKTNIPTDADIDSETDPIASPSSSPSLTACKNAKKASDGINGLNPKKMDLKNLITLFMCMVCESEEERAKTLQQVSNQMGIANLNLALSKRELDRDAAKKQYSSSKLEAIGTIAKSCAQFAVTCFAIYSTSKMANKNAELSSCKEAKASANLQKKLNENNDSLKDFDKGKLCEFDAGNKTTRKDIINEPKNTKYEKALESRKLILEDAESRGFTLKSDAQDGKIGEENFCKKFEVTVKNNDFTADDGNGKKLFDKGNKTYTSDNFYKKIEETGNLEETDFLKRLDSRIDTLPAEINIAENTSRTIQGIAEAVGGIVEGGFKLGAAGDKYEADKAKADKEAVDATMNLVNNLWSNFRQDFSAALNRVDKTASILKESIDALLQTNMQISRNI